MLKTEIGGTQVRVGFYHEQDSGWFISNDRPIKGYTKCTLKFGPKEAPTRPDLEGEAYCSTMDTFNKEIGRKVSLARAVQPLPREERRAIWEAYFSRRHHV